jgi:hypothetical protein
MNKPEQPAPPLQSLIGREILLLRDYKVMLDKILRSQTVTSNLSNDAARQLPNACSAAVDVTRSRAYTEIIAII